MECYKYRRPNIGITLSTNQQTNNSQADMEGGDFLGASPFLGPVKSKMSPCLGPMASPALPRPSPGTITPMMGQSHAASQFLAPADRMKAIKGRSSRVFSKDIAGIAASEMPNLKGVDEDTMQ